MGVGVLIRLVGLGIGVCMLGISSGLYLFMEDRRGLRGDPSPRLSLRVLFLCMVVSSM